MRTRSIFLLSLLFQIFIIPLNSQCETKITASDGAAQDNFGYSVSIDGNRTIIGAHVDSDNGFSSGSAYIYDWDGTNWNETKITASDAAAQDKFGYSVSINGNKAIIGAYWDGDNGFQSGSAYIYDWDGTDWNETKITPSDGAAEDWFGYSVSIEGDRAIIGAIWDDDNGNKSGSAYIYDWDGTDWNETKITPSDGAVFDWFGETVSIDGDRAIVGVPKDDDDGMSSGSAYIYNWDGTDWNETKITASDAAVSEEFGYSVSIEGDQAIVGAPGDDDNASNSGSAYIYAWDGTDWNETKITASDATTVDVFGSSVSIEGDQAIVGAPGDDDNASNSGSAYIYAWDGTNWNETKITASDGALDDLFGSSVSIQGGRINIGAFNSDALGNGSGSAYIISIVGSSCDDNNACTSNTTIQNDCSCSGGMTNVSTNTYLDAGSGLWHDINNWSLMEVPDACDDVLIQAGHDIILKDGETGTCLTLEVKTNASLIVEEGAILDVITNNN